MRATRKQNAIKIFAYPTGKYHSAYSPYALNELNLALSQLLLAQHEKLFKFFLSILDRMQWAKKPSHATVPLSEEQSSRRKCKEEGGGEVGSTGQMNSGWENKWDHQRGEESYRTVTQKLETMTQYLFPVFLIWSEGSVNYLYGLGSRFFRQEANIWRKTLISTVLRLFIFFYFWKIMQMYLQKGICKP